MLNLTARVTILTALSVVFCGMTAVLGAAPLFVLRNTEGRGAFFVGVIIAGAAMIGMNVMPLAIPFAAMALLVFAFTEGVEMGGGLWRSGFMALSLVCGTGLIGLGLWSKTQNVVISDLLREQLLNWFAQVPQLQSNLAPEVDSLVAQTPSAIVILLTIALWFGILFGKRFSTMKGNAEFQLLKLRDFTVPDVLIWLFIVVLPGTFLLKEQSLWQVISLNCFNFLMFLYFLKGLALVSCYFRAYRVGAIWQGLLYVLFLTQLFPLVAAFGIADIWMNFKGKLVKKSAEPIER
jgi:hypothetical protein